MQTRWLRPASLEELLKYRAQYPDARIVCGNTEVGVEMKFKHVSIPVMIAPTHVENLIKVGARYSIPPLVVLLSYTLVKMKSHSKNILDFVNQQFVHYKNRTAKIK